MADVEKTYEPTVKEAALLEVLLNPDNRRKSIKDLCQIANCSRQVYYEAFAKPSFQTFYESKAKDLIREAVVPIVNTFIKEALMGSYQHGRTVLEMAGLIGNEGGPSGNNIILINIKED